MNHIREFWAGFKIGWKQGLVDLTDWRRYIVEWRSELKSFAVIWLVFAAVVVLYHFLH